MRTPNDTRGPACSQTLMARNEPPDAVEEYRALWAMTRAERIAAMWRGELTTRQRCRGLSAHGTKPRFSPASSRGS